MAIREQLENVMLSDYVVTNVDIERSDFNGKIGLSTLAEISANLDIKQDLSEYVKKEEVNIGYAKEDQAIYLSAGDNITSVDCKDFLKATDFEWKKSETTIGEMFAKIADTLGGKLVD